MKMKNKFILAVIVIVAVTCAWHYFGTAWVSVLYAFILAIFPQEIKSLLQNVVDFLMLNRPIRVSFAYLFRIQDANLYLLVKDEQGRNSYHPVGGVYKYDPQKINITDRFDGIYDGVFNLNSDTEMDLRLKISRRKLNEFKKWFLTESGRESSSNLCREFVEELIAKQILPEKCFRCLTYKYVGSVTRNSKNERLNISQVHHFDIFELHPTTEQRNQIDSLRNQQNNANSNYVFATEEDIERGSLTFAGNVYEIADTSKYILVTHAHSLDKVFDLPEALRAHTKDAFRIHDTSTNPTEADKSVD